MNTQHYTQRSMHDVHDAMSVKFYVYQFYTATIVNTGTVMSHLAAVLLEYNSDSRSGKFDKRLIGLLLTD